MFGYYKPPTYLCNVTHTDKRRFVTPNGVVSPKTSAKVLQV